jgi:hypothetical protein
MPIELKQVIEFLGYKPEEIKELDDLKGKFEAEFVRTSAINEEFEPVKKLIGQAYGSFDSDLVKVGKANDIAVTEIEGWKEAKIKDKLKLLTSELVKSKEAIIKDLTVKASQNNDEKLNEITAALEKEKQKRKDTEGLLQNVSKEFDESKAGYEGKLKNIKLDTLRSNALSQIKWIDGVSELQTKGFNSIINEKYKFDLDEAGNKLVVTDAEGKQIQNPKVTGTFKSAEEVLVEEAVKLSLYKLNGDGGKPKPTEKKVTDSGDAKPLREVAKRFNMGQ